MARDKDNHQPPGGGPPTRVDPDADVIELVQQGKRDVALGLLMQRHGDAVYRFCRTALRDATRAEDVHQQVFIAAHRDLPRFAGRSLVRTWLFAIARNRVLDDVKATKRANQHVEHDDTAEVADPAPAPGDRLDDARLRQALVECVDELPEDVRALVLLRFQQGFTFEEIAEIFGETAGTLQARVQRLLPRLRDCIKKRTGGEP